jgi:hypothetical protein
MELYLHVGPTQPPIQWIPGFFSRGLSGRSVKLTTHLNLVPRLRIHGATPPRRSHPDSYTMGIGALFSWIKRPEREDGNSPQSSAEVEKVLTCTSIPPYIFMTWCWVKHSNNFTFTFTLLSGWIKPRLSTAGNIFMRVLCKGDSGRFALEDDLDTGTGKPKILGQPPQKRRAWPRRPLSFNIRSSI